MTNFVREFQTNSIPDELYNTFLVDVYSNWINNDKKYSLKTLLSNIVKNWDNIIHIVNLNNKNSFTNIILSLNNGVYDTRKTFKDMISKIYNQCYLVSNPDYGTFMVRMLIQTMNKTIIKNEDVMKSFESNQPLYIEYMIIKILQYLNLINEVLNIDKKTTSIKMFDKGITTNVVKLRSDMIKNMYKYILDEDICHIFIDKNPIFGSLFRDVDLLSYFTYFLIDFSICGNSPFNPIGKTRLEGENNNRNINLLALNANPDIGPYVKGLVLQWTDKNHNKYYNLIQENLKKVTYPVPNLNKVIKIKDELEKVHKILDIDDDDIVLKPFRYFLKKASPINNEDYKYQDFDLLINSLINTENGYVRLFIVWLYLINNGYKSNGKCMNTNGTCLDLDFKTIKGDVGTFMTPIYYLYNILIGRYEKNKKYNLYTNITQVKIPMKDSKQKYTKQPKKQPKKQFKKQFKKPKKSLKKTSSKKNNVKTNDEQPSNNNNSLSTKTSFTNNELSNTITSNNETSNNESSNNESSHKKLPHKKFLINGLTNENWPKLSINPKKK